MPDSQATRLSVLIGAAIIVFGLASYFMNGNKDVVGANPENAASVALGASLYAEHCASCHGDNLEGEPNWRTRNADGRLPAPPHDETGHTWHHPDEQLFAMTKFGVGAAAGQPDYPTDMPLYEDILSDDEIWAVLSYIKSTWSDDIRARQPKLQ